jgi:hypothetical protein
MNQDYSILESFSMGHPSTTRTTIAMLQKLVPVQQLAMMMARNMTF